MKIAATCLNRFRFFDSGFFFFPFDVGRFFSVCMCRHFIIIWFSFGIERNEHKNHKTRVDEWNNIINTYVIWDRKMRTIRNRNRNTPILGAFYLWEEPSKRLITWWISNWEDKSSQWLFWFLSSFFSSSP